MSRGARALTLYQGIWAGIIEARPDLNDIDWITIWGRRPEHDWSRVDPAKMNLASLMKKLNWHPSAADYSGSVNRRFTPDTGSEAYWKSVIESISVDGIQRFAAWAIKQAPAQATMIPELTDDEVSMLTTLTSPETARLHSVLQWGSW